MYTRSPAKHVRCRGALVRLGCAKGTRTVTKAVRVTLNPYVQVQAATHGTSGAGPFPSDTGADAARLYFRGVQPGAVVQEGTSVISDY